MPLRGDPDSSEPSTRELCAGSTASPSSGTFSTSYVWRVWWFYNVVLIWRADMHVSVGYLNHPSHPLHGGIIGRLNQHRVDRAAVAHRLHVEQLVRLDSVLGLLVVWADGTYVIRWLGRVKLKRIAFQLLHQCEGNNGRGQRPSAAPDCWAPGLMAFTSLKGRLRPNHEAQDVVDNAVAIVVNTPLVSLYVSRLRCVPETHRVPGLLHQISVLRWN